MLWKMKLNKADQNGGKMKLFKRVLYWDITPCSPLKISWPIGGTCRLHPQGPRISQARNQSETASRVIAAWRWGRYVSANFRLTFKWIHGLIPQKIEVLISTAVRNSKPTQWFCFNIYRKWSEQLNKCRAVSAGSIAMSWFWRSVCILRSYRKLITP
jgi:hypothetical protein